MSTASRLSTVAGTSRSGSVTPSVQSAGQRGGGGRVVRFGGRTERTRTASVAGSSATGDTRDREEGREDEEEEEGEDEIEEEDPAETTMCFFSIKAKLAAAYLDATTYKLHVMEDVFDNDAFDIAEMVLEQVKPVHILVNTSAEDALIDKIKAWADSNDGTMEVRPGKEFQYLKGKNRILALHLPPPSSLYRQSASSVASGSTSTSAYDFQRRAERMDDMDDDQRFKTAEMRIGGMLDWDKSFSVSATGALLSHLARAKARGELPGNEDGAMSVNGIEIFTPEAYMQINEDTLSSLQIFDEKSHAYMHSGSRTEGLSLYAILNNTRTLTGQALLKTWLQRPLLSVKDIAARHDGVQLFARADNMVQVQMIQGYLKGMANVSQVLGRMKKGTTTVKDWKALLEFSFRCGQMKDTAADLIGSHATSMKKKIEGSFDRDALNAVGQEMNDTIDWEESTAEDRVVIKHGVDEKLDGYKRTYAGIDSLLMKVADGLQQVVPRDIVAELNVTYFPQLGFLIAAKMVEPWDQDTQDIERLKGWSFQFATDESVYFKDKRMHDLDRHFGDLHSVLVDKEIEIAHKLSEVVLEQTEVIQDAARMCDELDCLISFAEVAHQSNYRRPVMTEDNVIVIKNGRHPLQELTIDHYVPNPTKIIGGRGIINTMSEDEKEDDNEGDASGDGHVDKKLKKSDQQGDTSSDTDDVLDGEHSVMVLTGTNASGKSVYGKAVALIVYMAQIGSFVPADAATIGICDKMFTRLSAKESVAKGQSSFMIDLGQISYALRNATPRSLIIADEFGKGTISTDGAGLLAGVIMHLLNRGERCPKMIAMTHFHELFTQNFLPPSLPISFASMEIIISPPKPEIQAQPITYLYRLVPHLSLTSHAAACARSQGLPGEVVDRAVEVNELLKKFEFLPLQNRQMTEAERDDLLYSERVCRAFLAHDFGPISSSTASAASSTTGGDVHAELRALLEMMDEDDNEGLDEEGTTATGTEGGE